MEQTSGLHVTKEAEHDKSAKQMVTLRKVDIHDITKKDRRVLNKLLHSIKWHSSPVGAVSPSPIACLTYFKYEIENSYGL